MPIALLIYPNKIFTGQLFHVISYISINQATPKTCWSRNSVTGSEDSYSHHAVAFKSTKTIPQGTHIVYSTALVMILYENTVANPIPSTKQLEITITPM